LPLDFKRLSFVILLGIAALTIGDVSRHSGLSGPTLRYYEAVGLIGPITRDAQSGHRRYRDEDLDTVQALACLRAMGVASAAIRNARRYIFTVRDAFALRKRRATSGLLRSRLRADHLLVT
jgi:hypothetical protein